MKITNGGITAAKGFLASGIHCGIKYSRKDLSLIYSRVPCVACGVFTQNKVQAAPIKITREHLRDNKAQAVIINSGNANCCTGEKGLGDAHALSQALAKILCLPLGQVLICSTGIIGRRLPITKIKNKLAALVGSLSKTHNLESAQAIMTTDTHPKQIAVQLKLGNKKVHIGGMAKGAGMVQPNMATMLAFITTDAVITAKRLQQALKQAVAKSFNLISVDGNTSTNDTVLALANGLAGNDTISGGDFAVFQQALNFVCLSLAKMIVQDGEGATKLIEIQVMQAKSQAQAKRVAYSVANSVLVKTAIFGQSPNWGRIAAAIGSADQGIVQKKLSVFLKSRHNPASVRAVKILHNGEIPEITQQTAKRILKSDQLRIKILLGLGKFATRVFSCDLSEKYVKINAQY